MGARPTTMGSAGEGEGEGEGEGKGDSAGRLKRLPRPVRWVVLLVAACVVCVGGYFGAAEILMRVPVHRDADPYAGDIDVYFVTNGVHIDIWVPAVRPERDWVDWLPSEVPATGSGYVAFGWGDEGFFLEVPTWDDLTAGVAIRGALWPTRSAVHVQAFGGPPYPKDSVHLLRLNAEEYANVVTFLDKSFDLDEAGRPVMLDHPGYRSHDRFFRGHGAYHVFRTCNTWTNAALKSADRRAALWTPFERGVRRHLPTNRGVAPL